MIKHVRRAVISILIGLILATLPSMTAGATDPKNKGLFISPLRNYITIDENGQRDNSFTIANLTDNTITVNLSY